MKRFLEIIWLVISIAATISCIDAFKNEGFSKNTIMFIIVIFLSLFMYIYRKNQRIKAKNK